MQLVCSSILINYEQFGSGPKVLVVLHGWGRSLNEWRFLGNEHWARDYTIYVIDLPGFGSSMLPPDDFDTYAYAELIHELCLRKEVESCTVLGHSFGGRLGIILASKYPELVDHLVLIDSGGIQERSIYLKARILFYKIFLKPFKSLIPDRFKNLLGSSDYKSAGPLRSVFVHIVNQDLQHLAGDITCKVSIIWGENDREVPLWHAKRWRDLLENSRLRIIWGASHSPHLEDADSFKNILKTIL